MSEEGDLFTYHGQKYRFLRNEAGSRKAPKKRKGKEWFIKLDWTVWGTICPDCGRSFEIRLGAEFPCRVKGIRRRCDWCKAPGKAVGQTSKKRELELWRPEAYGAIHRTVWAIYAATKRPVGPAAVGHALAEDKTMQKTVFDELCLDQFPYCGTKIGRIMEDMVPRGWLVAQPQGKRRAYIPQHIKPGEDFGVAARDARFNPARRA